MPQRQRMRATFPGYAGLSAGFAHRPHRIFRNMGGALHVCDPSSVPAAPGGNHDDGCRCCLPPVRDSGAAGAVSVYGDFPHAGQPGEAVASWPGAGAGMGRRITRRCTADSAVPGGDASRPDAPGRILCDHEPHVPPGDRRGMAAILLGGRGVLDQRHRRRLAGGGNCPSLQQKRTSGSPASRCRGIP